MIQRSTPRRRRTDGQTWTRKKNFHSSCLAVLSSQACVNNLLGPAQFTLYLAAPVEGTGAPFHHDDLLGPVASAAAHQITPVHPYRGVVALAAVRSLNSQPRIPIAEPRRRFQVY